MFRNMLCLFWLIAVFLVDAVLIWQLWIPMSMELFLIILISFAVTIAMSLVTVFIRYNIEVFGMNFLYLLLFLFMEIVLGFMLPLRIIGLVVLCLVSQKTWDVEYNDAGVKETLLSTIFMVDALPF